MNTLRHCKKAITPPALTLTLSSVMWLVARRDATLSVSVPYSSVNISPKHRPPTCNSQAERLYAALCPDHPLPSQHRYLPPPPPTPLPLIPYAGTGDPDMLLCKYWAPYWYRTAAPKHTWCSSYFIIKRRKRRRPPAAAIGSGYSF